MQSIATVAANWGLTSAQVVSLINQTGGNETTVQDTRFQLLDHTLTSIGPVGDITQYVSRDAQPPQISHDMSQAVHRSITFTFLENTAVDFNTFEYYVQVSRRWWSRSPGKGGTLLLDVPMGVFQNILPDREMLGMESLPQQVTGNLWKLSMTDVTGDLARQYLLDDRVDTAGSNVLGIVAQLCAPYRQAFTPSAATVTTTTQAAAGDNVLTYVNQLLASINYRDLWADETGTLRTDPIPYYSAQIPPVEWLYATDGTSTIRPGSIAQQFVNTDQLANVVKVLSQNNGQAPLWSIRQNNAADSLISTVNYPRGNGILPKVIRDDRIVSQEACDFRAFVELQKAAALAEQVTFTTALNPFHQNADALGLNFTQVDGTLVIGTAIYPWEESGFSLDLSTANSSMTHTVGKLVAI